MTNIRIQNSSLNATAWVDLQSTNWSSGLKRFDSIKPVIGQRPSYTSDGEYDIADGDQLGVENPIITVRGAIDTEEFATNAALHLTTGITYITLGYLKALWRVRGSSTTTLQIYFGLDNSKTLKNYSGSLDTITVSIESIDLTPREDSDGHHLINFTITMKEIKP